MSPNAIIDSHVHFWDPARFSYPWLEGLPQLQRSFLPKDFSACPGAASVNKFIFVESGAAPKHSLAEVEWVSKLAAGEPRLRGIIAHTALEERSVLRKLRALSRFPKVKGIRRNLQGETDPDFISSSEFFFGVLHLSEFNFTFDLCLRPDQIPAAAELAGRLPEVTFILGHCGKPPIKSGLSTQWAANLKHLATRPNVFCKISGLATEADWNHWRPVDFKYYFDWVLQHFGFDRILFGGDWPVSRLATTYERWLTVVSDFFSFASEAERAKLFQLNAERIYRV